MKKRGDSELVAEILLIVIVIMLISIVLYFFLGYLKEKEDRINIQRGLNNEKLDINDVEFDDLQKLTLVLGKGAGGQDLYNRTNQSVSRMNITVVRLVNQTNVTHINTTMVTFVNQTNVTHTNITMVTFVNETNVTNSTIIYVPNSTIINGSNADIVTVNDVSGSMSPAYGQGDKIGELKNASRDFVSRTLNGTTNSVGLVAYETSIVGLWSTSLTNNSAVLISRINSWSTLGATCICCGIIRGIDYLKTSTRTKIMIVLSDGGANQVCSYFSPELSGNPPSAAGTSCSTGANDACDDAINATKSGFIDYGIITYSIGFGTAASVDSVTLRNISRVGNGTYYFSNLTGLSEVFEKIQQNITWMEGINISFNQTVNVTWTEQVNVSWNESVTVTWIDQVNVSWNESVTTEWIEQINETINETVEIEIYTPETSYDYLKIVFYAGGKSFSKRENVSAVPGPHETKEVQITLEPSWGITTNDLTKIEIFAVALTESGKEVISSAPIAIWEKESLYTQK